MIGLRKIVLHFIAVIFISKTVSAQVNYQVKVMSWNLLNWPNTSTSTNDSTTRCPAYRTVIRYSEPDILITCENSTSYGIDWFRDQVMNKGPYHFASGTFINGPDTDNGIFYRDSLFEFLGNTPVTTALRDISHFTLKFIPTGDTLHIFSAHLKASQGFENERDAEVGNLRAVTNLFPAGTNFLIGGDFNIYESNEPAYLSLLQDNAGDDGNFLDPLNMPGVWNHVLYAPFHTQSTRYNATGGGAGGGMNDRFDFILYSNAVAQPVGVYYMPGTYRNIGNDGHHYDDAINYGTNTAVGAAVANALFTASDHLPVELILQIGPTAGIDMIEQAYDFEIYPQPCSSISTVRFKTKQPENIRVRITDIFGRLINESVIHQSGAGQISFIPDWKKISSDGLFIISVFGDNWLINKKVAYFK
jgi:hypothetical protein